MMRESVRVAGGFRRLDLQRSIAIDRPGENLVADGLLDGHRLAGDRRLVDGGVARSDLAVEGNALAGFDEHGLTDFDG